MKILVVTQYFHPEPFRINDLVSGLLERGHSIKILTGLPDYPSGDFYEGYGLRGPYTEAYGGAEVIRVPHTPRKSGGRLRLILNYFSFALSASFFGKIRCKERFDAIFVFEPSPITVALPAIVLSGKSKPVFLWVQDLWPESISATGAIKSSAVIRWVRSLVKAIYDRCEVILIQSKAFQDSIESFGVEPCRIKYFPNTAESLYQETDALNRYNVPSLPVGFIVMFAGNIGEAQAFGNVIQAAKILRSKGRSDIRWVIVGDGRAAAWLAAEVAREELQDSVILMGRHPVEEMPSWFSKADVMLVSLRKDPIFALTVPAKVQSYLACGKPIVGCLEGEGGRIISESQAGIAVEPEQPGALAETILQLADFPKERLDEMGNQGRDYFQRHFAREKLLDDLEGWFQDASENESTDE